MFDDILKTITEVYRQGSKDHSDQKNTSSEDYLIRMTALIMEHHHEALIMEKWSV
jgi:hypothetical protein